MKPAAIGIDDSVRRSQNGRAAMSTCIELRDGQVWWAANWAYDSVILRIPDQLDGSDAERELAALLR